MFEPHPLSRSMQTMNIRNASRRLHRDTHGAILLLGIVLGTALATALFYLVSIGEGILWREAAQNAADAGAFENAVWHARGMNMIVALNILLSLLSAVIVMWRLTLMALAFATLTELVSSMLEPGDERTSASLSLNPLVEMLSRDDQVAETISSIAAGLSAAQTAVATYTPVLATQVRSPERNIRGETMATATFSGSLLPAGASPALGNDLTNREYTLTDAAHQSKGSSSVVSKRLGMPFSLPVETESHSLLCPRLPEGFPQRSTMVVQRLPRGWRNRLLNVSGPKEEQALDQLGLRANGMGAFSLVESLYGLTTTAPALFCARPGPPIEQLKQVLWKVAERANDKSAASDASLSASIQAHLRDHGTTLTSLPEARVLFRRWQSIFDLDASALRFGTPAKVWSQAQNGNVYLRSTAVVSGKTALLGVTPFPVTNAPHAGAARIWAHAEAYFDCAKAWNECSPNAMWQLGWRARLRRVQPYALLLRRAGANPSRVDPSNLEATITHWLERSARQIGRSVWPPEFREFVPDFDFIPVRDTPTFHTLATTRSGADDGAPLAEFLERQGAANSVIH